MGTRRSNSSRLPFTFRYVGRKEREEPTKQKILLLCFPLSHKPLRNHVLNKLYEQAPTHPNLYRYGIPATKDFQHPHPSLAHLPSLLLSPVGSGAPLEFIVMDGASLISPPKSFGMSSGDETANLNTACVIDKPR